MPLFEEAVVTEAYTVGLGLLGAAAAIDVISDGHYLERDTR